MEEYADMTTVPVTRRECFATSLLQLERNVQSMTLTSTGMMPSLNVQVRYIDFRIDMYTVLKIIVWTLHIFSFNLLVNNSWNIECCGSKMYQGVANMYGWLSQYL